VIEVSDDDTMRTLEEQVVQLTVAASLKNVTDSRRPGWDKCLSPSACYKGD